MDLVLWIDIMGWVGSAEVILAYALISAHRINATSVFYQWLNLTGAIFLIVNTWYYGAFPSTAINIVWVFIAVIALYKVYFKKSITS